MLLRPGRIHPVLRLLALAVVFLVAARTAGRLFAGARGLFRQPTEDTHIADLYMRINEVRWIHSGFSPPEVKRVVVAVKDATATPDDLREYQRLAALGLPHVYERQPDRLLNGYPPSSYVTLEALFLAPSEFQSQLILFAINTIALVALGLWAAQITPGGGWIPRVVIITAALAICGVAYCYALGTLALLVALCLLLAMRLLAEEDSPLGGLLIGIALVKPTLALPFLFPLLIKRRWKAALVAIAYALISALLVVHTTQTPLFDWLKSISASAATFVDEGVGLLRLLTLIPGLDRSLAMRVVGPLMLLICFLLMLRFARLPMVHLFAIATATALMWNYFKWYDLSLLALLLIPLGAAALNSGRRWILAAFIVLAVSLWLPDTDAVLRHGQGPSLLYAWVSNLLWVGSTIFGLAALLAAGQPTTK